MCCGLYHLEWIIILDYVTHDTVLITLIYISCILTKVSDSSCASNTVDILLDVTGQVKINNMFHIGDVQSTSCYLRR